MRFFKLAKDERFSRAGWDPDAIESHSVHCPVDPGHQRSSGRLNELTIILESCRIADIAWTWYSECLLSAKVVELFMKEKVTGYDLAPVSISKILRPAKGMADIPRLWELQPRGWGGMAPPESGIRLLEDCPGCGLMEYSAFSDPSRLIDEKQWDGSDIFMVWPLPRYIFVTDRVRILAEKARLTGCKFTPVEKLPSASERGIVPGLSPGRLSHWMPEARAHELGDPLGIY